MVEEDVKHPTASGSIRVKKYAGPGQFIFQSTPHMASAWEKWMNAEEKHKSLYGHAVHFINYPDLEKHILDSLKLEEKTMNKSIVAVYEKTVDAVLVDKHFGREIQQTFTGELLLRQNKDAYLAEANKREELAKSRGDHPVCAA